MNVFISFDFLSKDLKVITVECVEMATKSVSNCIICGRKRYVNDMQVCKRCNSKKESMELNKEKIEQDHLQKEEKEEKRKKEAQEAMQKLDQEPEVKEPEEKEEKASKEDSEPEKEKP